jgi:hypothetical protein
MLYNFGLNYFPNKKQRNFSDSEKVWIIFEINVQNLFKENVLYLINIKFAYFELIFHMSECLQVFCMNAKKADDMIVILKSNMVGN